MRTEVKKTGMTNAIADLAKEYGVKPGHVFGVLADLGIEHDGTSFEADDEVLELVRESLNELRGSKEIAIKKGATPRDVALALDLPQNELQKTLVTKLRTMATLTTALKDEVVQKLFEQYGYTARFADAPKPRPVVRPSTAKPAELAVKRPPVVTVMGHVDHGKTSILDYIRKANVASREFGGITQHIGAYQVELPEGKITFLDTPGHAAFTQMRARGAQVTDIAILVVAADDGVMPTTIEAIQHAQNAKVPIIVAVNKIDKDNANPDRVLQQLPQYELIPEAYGGQIITVNVSAITGEGISQLLEMILLQADVMELKANPKAAFRGVVIEAKLEKGRGPVATILVQEGTLHRGDSLLVGMAYGRIKAMTDYRGETIAEAGPSTPVEVLGLGDVPAAGDVVEVCDSEKDAREVAEKRISDERARTIVQKARGLTLRDFRNLMQEEGLKALNLIVKADVQGSVEAVKGMLEKVRNEEVETKIILSGVGGITENDVLLAKASEAIVIGFNVKPEGKARAEAERQKVEIRTYNIIYELIEDIEAAAKGMLEPKFEEQYLGTAEIRLRMEFGRKGVIAGCYITDGKVTRSALCRVTRGRDKVYDGKIASLRHFKDDVREVTMGNECGMTFDDWQDFAEGDKVEVFEMIQVNA